MARKVTQSDIQTFNDLYKKLGTYAAVARATGWTAATVKRYITDDYCAPSDVQPLQFADYDFLPIDKVKENLPLDLTKWLSLSKEELDEMEEFKKGLSL